MNKHNLVETNSLTHQRHGTDLGLMIMFHNKIGFKVHKRISFQIRNF